MAIHPKLTDFSKVKNIRVFSKSLKRIEKDFEKLGGLNYEVEVNQFNPSTSFARRHLVDGGLGDAVEAMVVHAEFHDCPVTIEVPMSRRHVTMPYSILIELPLPMTGRAEYRRGALRNIWYCEPNSKSRRADLKNSLPKVKMAHAHGNLAYILKIGHSLEPMENNKTMWQIFSGYEGGMFSGGYRPRVLEFLRAIPMVKELLVKWNDRY